MAQSQSNPEKNSSFTLWEYHFVVLTLLSLILLGLLYLFFSYSRSRQTAAVPLPTLVASGGGTSQEGATNTMSQRFANSTGPVRIGINSGHYEKDSGAVCDDGLTERDVNYNIARQVADLLIQRGFDVDFLGEFDERINGYSAAALISIHADSCSAETNGMTGFKISGSNHSVTPILFGCVQTEYSLATQLPFDANTITKDMTDYHAFQEISPITPAIIIETGFLNGNRELLTTNASIPAQAIFNGILCFVEKSS